MTGILAMIGGAELLVIALVVLLFAGVAAALVVVVLLFSRRRSPDPLERRVEALEKAVQELKGEKKV